jgi:MATE family multidrug resistance protein
MAAGSDATSYRTLLHLAWPVVLSRASQAVIGFSDAAMVAPYGEDAIAAATTGASNTMNIFILPLGVAFIVQTFAAQLAGAGDLLGARRYGWYGLVLAAMSGVLALLLGMGVAPVLATLDYEPAVRDTMATYIEIRLFSTAAVIGTEALGAWYAGLGNTRVQMLVSFGAMAANLTLNWVFIYGNLGAPELGVQGAAIASAGASWLAFVAILVAFVYTRPAGGTAPHRARQPLRLGELGNMLRIGLPSGLNYFLEFGAFTFYVNWIVSGLGTTAVAALMAVIQVNMIAFMPAFGVASAGAILVGNAIGRDDRDAVPGIVRKTMIVTAIWMLVIGAIYALMPAAVMGLFESDESGSAAMVALGATMLLVSTAWQLFDAISITLSEALRAAGDTAWCMWARVVLAWVFFVPLAWYAVEHLGVGPVGAIACFIAYLAALAAVLWWRFAGGAWRKIVIT